MQIGVRENPEGITLPFEYDKTFPMVSATSKGIKNSRDCARLKSFYAEKAERANCRKYETAGIFCSCLRFLS